MTPTLAIENLSLRVPDRRLIDSLNVHFAPGEFWGIVGQNGVGKTTLLHTLAGLRYPQQGQVVLNGQDIFKLAPRKRAQKIGLLLQDTEIPFPITVLDTVLTGRYPHHGFRLCQQEEDIRAAKQALNLMKIASLSEREIHTLSGGERQKLMLATLFAQDPSIYLLDEPTNHLDLQQRWFVLSLFKKFVKDHKKTAIMVLHDIHFVKALCDHVIFIQDADHISIGRCDTIFSSENAKLFYPNMDEDSGIAYCSGES